MTICSRNDPSLFSGEDVSGFTTKGEWVRQKWALREAYTGKYAPLILLSSTWHLIAFLQYLQIRSERYQFFDVQWYKRYRLS